MRLLGVNIGEARPIANWNGKTGIDKHPQKGPVRIEPGGVAGDAICDRKHHGGPDQAVYCYLQSDYDWWRLELGRDLPPGSFGENLTIEGIDGTTLAVGDRIGIGEVLLEVTSHRTPCNTFARHMGDKTFAKRFHQAGRPGAYMRVLVAGEVTAGMEVTYTPFDGERFTVTEMMSLDGLRDVPEATIRRLLATPVHHKTRAEYAPRLAG